MAVRAPLQEQSGQEESSDDSEDLDSPLMQVLVPHRWVTLVDGSKVLIEPWEFEKTQILLPRLSTIYEVFQKGATDTVGGFASDLIMEAFIETKELVRHSMAEPWSDEQFAKLKMEDGLALTTAMVEVCLLRPEGGGLLPKVSELIGALNNLVGATASQT